VNGEAEILQDWIEILAFGRRGLETGKGIGREQDEGRNAVAMEACTDSVLARSFSGSERRDSATRAPKNTSTSAHSSIEPSWFPHTPVY